MELDKNTTENIEPPKQKPTRKKQGSGNDAKRVSLRLQFFNQNECPAYKKLKNIFFQTGISHPELKRIAEILAENCHLRLDRDAKRDNRVLIKWFDENWSILDSEIDRIKIYDSDFNLISGECN